MERNDSLLLAVCGSVILCSLVCHCFLKGAVLITLETHPVQSSAKVPAADSESSVLEWSNCAHNTLVT